MERSGFKQIDAPLRHIIVTNNGFKLVDHVFTLFHVNKTGLWNYLKTFHERNFLDTFFKEQVMDKSD